MCSTDCIEQPSEVEVTLRYGAMQGEKEEPQNVVCPTRVRNARLEPALPPMLEQHGFQLVQHKTSLTHADFHAKAGKIATLYYEEICEAVRLATGAAVVICFGHLRRGALYADFFPHVHTDFKNGDGQSEDQWAGPNTAAKVAEERLGRPRSSFLKGRYQILNAWRAISDTDAVEDDHLALCDCRSVGSHDCISEKSLYLLPDTQPGHEWYYYPYMTRDELLLFKQWDSRAPTARCFHTSFSDPMPRRDLPKRESIDVRVLVVFGDDGDDNDSPVGE